MREKLFVRNLHALAKDARIEAKFAVRSMQFCPRKNGGGYLNLELADTTGCIRAKWWDHHEGHTRALEVVWYGLVHGRVDDYQQTRSVIVTGIDDMGVPDNLADFDAVATFFQFNAIQDPPGRNDTCKQRAIERRKSLRPCDILHSRRTLVKPLGKV